jgi:hypothetical protein
MMPATDRFPIGSFWALWHLLITVRFNNALHWLFDLDRKNRGFGRR